MHKSSIGGNPNAVNSFQKDKKIFFEKLMVQILILVLPNGTIIAKHLFLGILNIV